MNYLCFPTFPFFHFPPTSSVGSGCYNGHSCLLLVFGVSLSESELSVECIHLLPPISFPGMSCSFFCCGSVVIGTKVEQFQFSSFCELSWVPCSLNAKIFRGRSASWNVVFVVFYAFPSSSISSTGEVENCHPLGLVVVFFSYLFYFVGKHFVDDQFDDKCNI